MTRYGMSPIFTRRELAARAKARTLFRLAIKKGRIVPPSVCSRCGTAPKRSRAGNSQVQGHHPDYTKPLEVVWLCVQCHATEHRTTGYAPAILKTHVQDSTP